MGGLRVPAAALATVMLAACGGGSGDETALVVQECKDSVQGHLAYNADFPTFDPTPQKDPAGGWHVAGTVTAQNGFGATQSLRWTCTVDSNGDVTSNVG